jgi:hypothetical protein
MKQFNIFLPLCVLLATLSSCGSSGIKENQTIAFDNLAPHNLSEGSFILKATASSGLQVTFLSSDTTIATVRDSAVTFHSPGTVEITAVQQGNAKYYQAALVIRSLIINEDNNAVKKNQTISFVLNETVWKLSQGTLTLNATASSGLAVTFTSSNISYALITGNLLTVSSGAIAGNNNGEIVVITASQAGNYEYNSAPTVTDTLNVIHDVH